MRKDTSIQIMSDSNKSEILKKTKKLKQSSILMAVLPLAACGGGGGGGETKDPDEPADPAPAPAPAPAPDPDFTESPTNVFIALDNSGRTLSEGENSANLTVTGKAGSDSITTGSGADKIVGAAGNDTILSNGGNDLIRAGEGRDTVSAGSGNDAIVVVGTTTAGQYTNTDITNSGGSGTNLSSLLNLADLNGRTVSEVVSGESIDGGTGTNTLFIYGTVDLTGVTLNNVTVLVVNSNVTLTAEQMALFTTVDGDGTSTINIEVPPGDTYIIDLSVLNITDIGSLNIDGDVTFIIDDENDLDGINAINTNSGDDVSVEINGSGGTTSVNLSVIADKIDKVDTIKIDEDVELVVDNPADITDLGLTAINGGGEIDTGGNTAVEDALDNIEVVLITAGSDSFSTPEDTPIFISFDELLANDSSQSSTDISVIAVSLVGSSDNNADIEINYDLGGIMVTPDHDYAGSLSLSYTIRDGDNNTADGAFTVSVSSRNDLPTGYGSTTQADTGMTHDGAIYIGGFLLNYDGERLNIDDPDSSNNNIYIRVEDISGGYISNSGTTVTEFTYNDINSGEVVFVSTGGTPTLVLSFSNDGYTYGNPTDVAITDIDSGSIFILTQGGTFGSSETISLNTQYLMDGSDKFFYADDVNATFTNHGVLESYGIGYLTPLFMQNVDTITNTGMITAYGENDNAAAIYVQETGSVINSGMIKARTSSNSGDLATGVFAPEVDNSGTIYATGYNATGVAHTTGLILNNSGVIYSYGSQGSTGVLASYQTSNVINSGTIIAYDDNEAGDAVGIDFFNSIATLDNSGTISSEVAISANYSLNMTNSGTINGDIAASINSDIIVNTGTIYGNITLGNAADLLDNENGQIFGMVDGGAGNDLLTGSAYDDYIDGGADDDYIVSGSGGNDVLVGGTGDDIFDMEHLEFVKIDGGTGFDSFVLTTDSTDLDFAGFDVSKISNIEEIYLGAVGVSLNIDAEHVIAITDSDNILRIRGNANDLASSSSTWTAGNNQIIDTITYFTYTSGDATILIEETVTFDATIIAVVVPTISIDDITTDEADETDTFTVSLSHASASTITVDYDAPDGSSGTLTFNPGNTEKTFASTWTDDATDEADEVVAATLSNPSNATIADDSGQLIILDDDGAPTISIDDISTNEADETDTFTVSLSAVSGKTITVDYDAPDGSSGTLIFNPGETEKTFVTTWSDDDVDEANEVVNATLSNPSNATISDDTGQLTIQDDDVTVPSLSINDIETSEAAETASYIVTLSEVSTDTVTVNYSAPDGSSGTLTFKPGETHQTFKTTWTDDAVIESDEVVNATLSAPNNATIEDGTAKLIITDDDKEYTITIDDGTFYESSELAVLTLTLSEAATTTVRVEYDTSDGRSGYIVFYPGETEKTYRHGFSDDTVIEADEVITVTLSNPVNATLNDDTGIITIEDDDDTPNLTIDWIQADEADAIDTFTVTLSETSGQVITVDYLAPDGTNGTLTFNPGETEKTFNTSWTDDAIAENHEIIWATLSNATNASISEDQGRLVIANDDPGNRAPQANDLSSQYLEHTAISVDVLPSSNDSDGDEITLIDASLASGQGTVSIDGGEIHYDPGTYYDYLSSNEAVLIVIDFTISDGELTDTGTLTNRVQGVNDAPIAIDDTTLVQFDETITIDALDNDADAENDALTITNAIITSGNGNVSIVDGELLYDPDGDYDHLNPGDFEIVTLSYTISDGQHTDTGEVSVSVENEPPLATSIDRLQFLEGDIVDLTGNGDNTFELTIDDLLQSTDADNILKILGDTGDSVTSTGEGWAQGADQDVDGETYNTFTAGGATLLIDEDITQDIS